MSDLRIVVMRNAIVLVRRADALSSDDTEQNAEFVTSLGPFDRDGVLDTFENEWPDLLVTHHDAIRTFINDATVPPSAQLRLEAARIP